MGFICNGKCTSKARLENKTVVITGANTGIGKYTALDLYRRGARVILACRDTEKAEQAVEFIKQECANLKPDQLGELKIVHLDLSSLSSVRKCAEEILKEEKHIHILINNAGVMMCPRTITEDGYELQFATNHLGHFLFTMLLLPTILRSAPGRIVNVASKAHIIGNSLDFDDINLEKSYNSLRAYGRSKLSNILFTRELAKKLKGTNVTCYSLHPGVVDTELSRHFDRTFFPGIKWFYQNVGKIFMKSAEQGAQTTLYCAVDETLANESGQYYDDCQKVIPTQLAQNDELAKTLWDVSVEMVKLGPDNPFKNEDQVK